MRSRRAKVTAVAAAVTGLSLVAASAAASVLPSNDATALGQAAAGGVPLVGAVLQVPYECEADDPTTDWWDETRCPTGIGTVPTAGFPTHGSTYAVLTTGNAVLAPRSNDGPGDGEQWDQQGTPIPGEVYDQQVLALELGPATASCLAFDFRFLSEEFPEFVERGFNDAFIAQLNTWQVSVDPLAQTVSAPGDFAGGAGDSISVDASGPSAMTAELAAGTTYDGGTLPLVARTRVQPGSTNTLYLTLFDQGDGIYDSAVLVDNVRYEEQPAHRCKSLAVDPFEGGTGVVVVPGGEPSFGPGRSSLAVPVTCDLPSGPIGCRVEASATFAGTALATGSAELAAGADGSLVMATTPEGVAAVAQAEKKVKKQQRKLTKRVAKLKKQVKKLRKATRTAQKPQARKLKKKATKTKKKVKRARKKIVRLRESPLGTVTVAVTNPANGVSGELSLQLRR